MKRTLVITVTSASALLGLAACGGNSSPAPTSGTATTPSVAPSAAASGTGGSGGTAGTGGGTAGTGRAGGRQQLAGLAAQLPAIRTCLADANLPTADLPTAIPSFAGRPSGAPRPSFNPSDRPTARPSGGFGGGNPAGGGRFGGLFQIFTNAQDQSALKACGITVPTFTGRRPGAAPGGSAATTPATT